MNYKDLPEKANYSVGEYNTISILIDMDLKTARKHKDASRARLHTVNFHPYGGQDAYCSGISGYVVYSPESLAGKKKIFCKTILKFQTIHKNYEKFIKTVAKAEDELYEFEKDLINEKNTAHQLLRKVVSKYGFKLWDSRFHRQDASSSGTVLGKDVSVHYDKKANNFSIEIYHLEIDEIEKVLGALKGLEKKA